MLYCVKHIGLAKSSVINCLYPPLVNLYVLCIYFMFHVIIRVGIMAEWTRW